MLHFYIALLFTCFISTIDAEAEAVLKKAKKAASKVAKDKEAKKAADKNALGLSTIAESDKGTKKRARSAEEKVPVGLPPGKKSAPLPKGALLSPEDLQEKFGHGDFDDVMGEGGGDVEDNEGGDDSSHGSQGNGDAISVSSGDSGGSSVRLAESGGLFKVNPMPPSSSSSSSSSAAPAVVSTKKPKKEKGGTVKSTKGGGGRVGSGGFGNQLNDLAGTLTNLVKTFAVQQQPVPAPVAAAPPAETHQQRMERMQLELQLLQARNEAARLAKEGNK